MNLQQLKHEVLPMANAAFKDAPAGGETESKSAIKEATFQWGGISFRVLEQNRRKVDRKTQQPTRFAKLANNGHEVFWLIREDVNEWYLVVDGKAIAKNGVSDEGVLLAGSEF